MTMLTARRKKIRGEHWTSPALSNRVTLQTIMTREECFYLFEVIRSHAQKMPKKMQLLIMRPTRSSVLFHALRVQAAEKNQQIMAC